MYCISQYHSLNDWFILHAYQHCLANQEMKNKKCGGGVQYVIFLQLGA